MSGIQYDPEHIARFYDEYGAREWERFDLSAMDRVGLEVHLRLLREHIRVGDRVLDAGAGPGRFTLELARLGARVVVGDISPAQLKELPRGEDRLRGGLDRVPRAPDVADLGRFPDGSFDAALCFGGPLSYVLGEADRALFELLRVTKRGGRVLLSVMSLLGTARAFFEQISGLVDEFGWQRAVVDVFETGDLDGELNKGHVLRLYRWSSLKQLLGRHPCRVITASAANFLSARNDAWDERFLKMSSKRVANPEPSTVARTSSLFSSEPEHRRSVPRWLATAETLPHTRAAQGAASLTRLCHSSRRGRGTPRWDPSDAVPEGVAQAPATVPHEERCAQPKASGRGPGRHCRWPT